MDNKTGANAPPVKVFKKKGGFHTLKIGEKRMSVPDISVKHHHLKDHIKQPEKRKSFTHLNLSELQITSGKKYITGTQQGKDDDGKLKTNQDRFVYIENIFNIQNCNIYGILDGHGSNGHFVSEFCAEEIKKFFTDEANFITKQNKTITKEVIYQKLTHNNYTFLKKFYTNLQKELIDATFDTHFSGTTCVIVYQIDDKIICSNIGDSRSILLNKNNKNEYDIIELSKDQKPTNPEEQKRILESGGEIAPCDDEIDLDGPKRVWVKGEKFPGIAISRTLGDEVGKSVGVICTPEFIETDVNKNSFLVICASDGVWEFLSNEEVRDIIVKNLNGGDYNNIVKAIIKESNIQWENEGVVRDDITCVIHYF